MKRKAKFLSVSCIAMLMAYMITISAQAQAGVEKKIDGSYLTHDTESVGTSTKTAKGKDLLTGYSKCVILANGDFYGGGTTIAAHTVERIGIGVTIQRATEDDETWSFYDGWIKFDENADTLSSNGTYRPQGGYYYRVRCIHSANDDVSTSFTDGLYIE